MSVHRTILKQLRSSPNSAVERALGAALPLAAEDEAREIVDLILQRNRRPGWIALVRNFHRLPQDVQDRLLANPRDLFGPLSDTMEDDAGASRSNVIEIVRKSADPKLVFLLTEALSDTRLQVRNLAAEALLESVRRYMSQRREVLDEMNAIDPAEDLPASGRPGQEHDTDPDDAQAHHETVGRPSPGMINPSQLRHAVDFSMRQFKMHQNAGVVRAALIFERQQESVIWERFRDGHDETTRIAIGMLRHFDDAELATAIFVAMGTTLKPAALAGFSGCTNAEALTALARESFRLIDPAVANAVATLPHPRAFMTVTKESPWNEQTWFGFLRLIRALGMAPAHKLPWLTRLAEEAPAGAMRRPARMLVIQALDELNIPDAAAPIAAFTADPDEAVARLAARIALSRHHDWKPHAAVILQSPHESVRRLVSHAATPGQFEQLWHEYLRLPPAVQVLSARTLSETDSQFNELLRSRLASTQVNDLVQGLKMLTTLTNIAPFREAIIRSCGHPDGRIAATAVRLAGSLEDPTLKDLLEAAARHPDPRVRANAVESMEKLQVANRSHQLLSLLDSRHNRERANAIKALSQFDFQTARECLVKMLTDGSPQHRVSALWVVGQLEILEVIRQVGILARRDPNQHVRKRAEEILDRLHQATHPQSIPAR